MDPIATARYGMMAAARRLEASAGQVARMGDGGEIDLAQEAASQIDAGRQFTASSRILDVADEMWRALIDLQSRKR